MAAMTDDIHESLNMAQWVSKDAAGAFLILLCEQEGLRCSVWLGFLGFGVEGSFHGSKVKGIFSFRCFSISYPRWNWLKSLFGGGGWWWCVH
jgi:hypothetical protein